MSDLSNPLNIGLIGFGTVGHGVFELLESQLKEKLSRPIHIHSVAVQSITPERQALLPEAKWTTDPLVVATDEQVDVVVELMGGVSLAFEVVKAALMHRKPVITANKALLAEKGQVLFALAKENGCPLLYEAAVAGGIPIVNVLSKALACNQIHRIDGIVNGTANYIVSQMLKNQWSFDNALAEASRLGYAEADPSFDIDGIDAAHKALLLAHLAYGLPLTFDALSVQGIRQVDYSDVAFANQLGFALKLIVSIGLDANQKVDIFVGPALVPHAHPLGQIDGVMNAVLVHSTPLGESLYVGAGAGSGPTATSVVADLLTLMHHASASASISSPHEPTVHAGEAIELLPKSTEARTHLTQPYYCRLMAKDAPGVLAKITELFAQVDISIETISQQQSNCQNGLVPVVIITNAVNQAAIHQLDKHLANLTSVASHLVYYPVVQSA